MGRLEWDKAGEHLFETGVDHGVLYPLVDGKYSQGVAWNGLTGVTETPSGGEDNKQYADNIEYLNIRSAESFGVTIECFYYPPEWEQCDGSAELAEGVNIGQQARNGFGLCYRTRLGNDQVGDSYGYKLHLIYGCSTAPSEVGYTSVNDSPEANTFSYEVSTTPVTVTKLPNARPTSRVIIDSTKVDKDKLAALEDILYGVNATGEDDGGTDARLPLPDEIYELFHAAG